MRVDIASSEAIAPAYTLEEFIRLTCNAYGGDVIRQLAGRYGVTL